MSVYQKVRSVNALFKQVEIDIQKFRKATDINCFSGCGFCCHKPDIEASVLEFLPFAYYAFRIGKAEEVYEQLLNTSESAICILHKLTDAETGKGFCGSYEYRGLICRLFGYSAMLGREGKPVLVTCKKIKTESPEAYQGAVDLIEAGYPVPVMSNYYRRLVSIDHQLGSSKYPINKAMLEALKNVLSYYSYRRYKKPA